MKTLLSLIAILCVASAVGGIAFTMRQGDSAGWVDVGKALMTLTVSALIGGVVVIALKVIEREREKRTIWAKLLADVMEVDQALLVARQLIKARKTAKAYSEQLDKVVNARLILRRVWIDPLVANDRGRDNETVSLRDCLDTMKEFVDDLGQEYEENYLAIARQQRIDEIYLKRRETELARDYPTETSFQDPMYQPTRAWELMRSQKEQFRHLRELIGDEYDKCCFVTALLQIKPMLERRAGIKRKLGNLEATVPQ
jgi:hypothetical protein